MNCFDFVGSIGSPSTSRMVYLALHHRLDIKRIPVRLRANETSSVRLLRDSARGMFDVLSIKYHQLRGHYASLMLASTVRSEFEELQRGSRPVTAGTGSG